MKAPQEAIGDATHSFVARSKELSDDDERLIAVLDEYAAALQRGEAESPSEFAQKHRDCGEGLIGYLDGVRAIHAAVESARDHVGPGSGQVLPSAGALTEDVARSAQEDVGVLGSAGDHPPRLVGDYEIVREIGRGGMGVVYEAQEQSLRRRVALKVLPFAAVLDHRQISRFRNEAQAAAGLHHTNIVPVFAIGQERGVHYYAMQYIEGQTLAQAIAELRRQMGAGSTPEATTAPERASSLTLTPVPPAAVVSEAPLSLGQNAASPSFFLGAAKLASDAADALQHAHDLGVVHRDIKPSNLLVDERGKVWVADFGLARMQTDLGVTATGDVIGTLRYMSPEQARGRPDQVDGRTDVYALGATLYELLTLRHAFPGEDRVRLLECLQRDDPTPPRRLNPAIPVDLENIVLRAMEKDRDARYASAGEFRDDLLRFLDGRPTIARPPSIVDRAGKWMRRRRKTVAIAAVALGVVAVVSTVSAVLVAVALEESERHRVHAERTADHARQVLYDFGSDLSDQLAAIPGAEQVRREALEKILNHYHLFLKESDANARLTADVALTRVHAAVAAEGLGNFEEALANYDSAAGSLEELIVKRPNDALATDCLAQCLNNRGLLLSQRGDLAAAEAELRRAVDLRRSLLVEEPNSPVRMADLAGALSNAASIAEPGSAAPRHALEEAVDLLGVARRVDPNDPGHTRRLAVAHNSLATLLRHTDADRAAQESDRAVEKLSALAKDHPSVDAYRADLALAYGNRGALAADQQQWANAAEAYRGAAAELALLTERSPLVPRHRSELAVALASEGAALARLGKRTECDAVFDRAQRELETLVQSFPSTDRYTRSLAALWNNRGVVLRDSGRLDEASEAFAESVKLEERRLAMSESPGPTLLEMQYANQVQLLGRMGRVDEAARIETKRQALVKQLSSPLAGEAGKEKTL